MMTLTTRERDILRIILKANRPIGSVELAEMLHLTPRQVNYSLKGVRVWLKHHDQHLETVSGLGFTTVMPPDRARSLSQKIDSQSEIQIVLSVSQRQQMLALFLLTQPEPVILSQLEQAAKVSRMTLIKDLDEIERWFTALTINLIRKPHFGILAAGPEQAFQRALAQLLWGETVLSNEPIVEITHQDGLNFKLQRDASFLPVVEHIKNIISQIKLRRTISLVAQAEEQLGGRFSDDAVLHLALTVALEAHRVQGHHHLEVEAQQLSWLQTTAVWPIAAGVAQRLSLDSHSSWKPMDVAGIAQEMLAAPRHEILPGDLEQLNNWPAALEALMTHISQALELPSLKQDHTLQNGLISSIVPAYFRQQFNLWFPSALNSASLPEACERESAVAQEVANIVQARMQLHLPAIEINNLVVLLRAAAIRNRTHRLERVIVVCPSGMATAQLLIARVKARFPHLNTLEVVSLRDLTLARAATADLILTTIPLPRPLVEHPKAIQVHPLLTPEDIETIAKFLS